MFFKIVAIKGNEGQHQPEHLVFPALPAPIGNLWQLWRALVSVVLAVWFPVWPPHT
jgi:hypothetical protein